MVLPLPPSQTVFQASCHSIPLITVPIGSGSGFVIKSGLTKAQVGGFSCCRKSKAAMSYDYAVDKGPLGVRLFGLDAIGKHKILRSVSHRQSSAAFFWGGIWASKLLRVIGIHLYGAKEISTPED
ncbi:hypothetical protein TNCV_765771 [Trichonephila clavipes]|nr:hypothetical protein TNCV_765771 [Trichonephila clavipes]